MQNRRDVTDEVVRAQCRGDFDAVVEAAGMSRQLREAKLLAKCQEARTNMEQARAKLDKACLKREEQLARREAELQEARADMARLTDAEAELLATTPGTLEIACLGAQFEGAASTVVLRVTGQAVVDLRLASSMLDAQLRWPREVATDFAHAHVCVDVHPEDVLLVLRCAVRRSQFVPDILEELGTAAVAAGPEQRDHAMRVARSLRHGGEFWCMDSLLEAAERAEDLLCSVWTSVEPARVVRDKKLLALALRRRPAQIDDLVRLYAAAADSSQDSQDSRAAVLEAAVAAGGDALVLMYAAAECKQARVDVSDAVLALPVTAEMPDNLHARALVQEAARCHPEEFIELAQRCGVSVSDMLYGVTALDMCVTGGTHAHLSLMRELLGRGVRPDRQALRRAFRAQDDRVAVALIQAGALFDLEGPDAVEEGSPSYERQHLLQDCKLLRAAVRANMRGAFVAVLRRPRAAQETCFAEARRAVWESAADAGAAAAWGALLYETADGCGVRRAFALRAALLKGGSAALAMSVVRENGAPALVCLPYLSSGSAHVKSLSDFLMLLLLRLADPGCQQCASELIRALPDEVVGDWLGPLLGKSAPRAVLSSGVMSACGARTLEVAVVQALDATDEPLMRVLELLLLRRSYVTVHLRLLAAALRFACTASPECRGSLLRLMLASPPVPPIAGPDMWVHGVLAGQMLLSLYTKGTHARRLVRRVVLEKLTPSAHVATLLLQGVAEAASYKTGRQACTLAWLLIQRRGAQPNGSAWASQKTPLHCAAQSALQPVAHMLLRAGADPWFVSPVRMVPAVCLAAQQPESLGVLKLLLGAMCPKGYLLPDDVASRAMDEARTCQPRTALATLQALAPYVCPRVWKSKLPSRKKIFGKT
jgi:hypothetical protein